MDRKLGGLRLTLASLCVVLMCGISFSTKAQVTAEELQQNAQPHVGNGWAKFGAAMARSDSEAFERGAYDALTLMNAMEAARSARAESDRSNLENSFKVALVKMWRVGGLPPSEALAVASSYTLDSAQFAITERVKREGWQQAIDQAFQAYGNYNYQLANQLLIAARIANIKEHQEESSQAPAEQEK